MANVSYRSQQRVDEAGPDAGPDLSDGHSEARGPPLQGWVMRQGQVGLGHTDRQVIEALKT